jgi:L-lactate dehydrogenase (cytochrome)
MYGLSAGGEAGVHRVLELLKSEIDVDLALLGCSNIGELNRSYLRRVE